MVLQGHRHEDWSVQDVVGMDLKQVRAIRDDSRARAERRAVGLPSVPEAADA